MSQAMSPGEHWSAQADCYGRHDADWMPVSTNSPAARLAVTICKSCPVQTPCLADALQHEAGLAKSAIHGIYGGLNVAQRHALLAKAPTRQRAPAGIPVVCARCHDHLPNHGRGLCRRCYRWATRNGQLDTYPPLRAT
jgi:hypothetical protein